MAIGAPRHAHRVRQAGVELQRRVPGDVAVLAARVLEHLLHRGERRDRLHLLLRSCARAAGDQRRPAGEATAGCSARMRLLLSWPECSGSSRRRWPVSANTALATAGAIGGTPGSPTPPGFSVLGTMWTSTTGISFRRSTW